jgi:hypothetical protein
MQLEEEPKNRTPKTYRRQRAKEEEKKELEQKAEIESE